MTGLVSHPRAMVQLSALITAGLVAFMAIAQAETLEGLARVIDGDTLEVGSIIIRLADIDAPELGQKCDGPKTLRNCGKVAADFLADRIEGQLVTCEVADIDDYGRAIASCGHVGEDLSGWPVRDGYALAFVRYSDRYVPEKQAARAREAGLWRAIIEPPWEYRAHRWEFAAQEAPEGCPIKGNISRNNGDHIYHATRSPHYERTKVSVGKDERWFCSESEALAAGWRPPSPQPMLSRGLAASPQSHQLSLNAERECKVS